MRNFVDAKFEEVKFAKMRTTLIIAILFAGLLSYAYSAPQSNAGAVMQELQSILAQNSASKETTEEQAKAIGFLCKMVGEKTVDANPTGNGRVRNRRWVSSLINGLFHGGRAAGLWDNQQRTATQQQEKAEVIGLACTPVQTQPNGEINLLMHN